MAVDRSRITLLAGLGAVLVGGRRALTAAADTPLAATVYKEPT